jgi:hypothetical protein
MNTTKRLWIGIIILIILTPLGLLAQGTAWGEWSPEEFSTLVGYVPKGLEKGSGLWAALLADYSIPGWGDSFLLSSLGYIFSAAIGTGMIIALILATGKFLTTKEENKENDNP